jgi:hypothetical protein
MLGLVLHKLELGPRRLLEQELGLGRLEPELHTLALELGLDKLGLEQGHFYI